MAQQWRRVHFLSSCSSFSFLEQLGSRSTFHRMVVNQNGTREGREAGWERGEERLEDNFFVGLIFLAQVVQPAQIPETQCQPSCQSLGRSSPWSGRRNFGPVACAVLTPRTNSCSAAGLLKGQTVHSSLKLDIHLKHRLVKASLFSSLGISSSHRRLVGKQRHQD